MKLDKRKLISIVTCCYNSEKTLPDTIASLLRLNEIGSRKIYFEFIIVDSSDTKKVRDMIKASKLKFIYHKIPKSGVYDAMNLGIQVSSGDYIWFLNSDDWLVFENFKIEELEKKVENDLPFFFGRVIWFKTTYNNINGISCFNPLQLLSPLACFPPHPATIAKRSLLTINGGFNTKFEIAGDYFKFLEMVRLNNITIDRQFYCENFFVAMRMGGVSSKNLKSQIKKFNEDYLALKLTKYSFINLVMKRVIRFYFFIEFKLIGPMKYQAILSKFSESHSGLKNNTFNE